MRKSFWVMMIFINIAFWGLSGRTIAQEQIPTPEFYGIYMVSDGKLISPKDAVEGKRLKTVGNMFSSRFGLKELSGISTAANTFFLVYGKDFSSVLYSLKLGKFEFVKQVLIKGMWPAKDEWHEANMWILKEDIPMNIGPVKGQDDLFRLVPVSPLSDGVYALYIGPVGGDMPIAAMDIKMVADFEVGKAMGTRVTPSVESPSQGNVADTPKTTTIPSLSQGVVVSLDDDPLKGNNSAPVTIIEFSDYQSPFDGRFFKTTLPEIEREYIKTGKIRYVFRDFPLEFHKQAPKAAEAANCAGEQGKYWEMHDKLFENQGDLQVKKLSKYAAEIGIDSNTFNACLDGGKYAGEIKKDMDDGRKAGVKGTPSFFIGKTKGKDKEIVGKMVTGARPFSTFKEVIDQEILAAAANGTTPESIQQVQRSSSSPDSQANDAEMQKLKTLIADQWKQVAQIPPPKREWRELVTLKITGKYDDYSSLYLLGVNMRGLANDALNSANKFLKKGDLTNAQKYANIGTRYYIESNNLFSTSEQIFSGSVSMTAQALEAVYRGTTEASKYGWLLTCGPKCYEVADYAFLMTDFAVDYSLEGMDEAQKNLITKAFVKTLLKMDGISGWIENRTTHLIGGSGLYSLMDETIASPDFQKAFMKVLAESGAYATQKITEAGVKDVVKNSRVFVKSSSNLKPAGVAE